MPQCSAPKCRNKGAHVFPQDPTRRKQWENALPIKNFMASKSARLCSLHFKADDFFGKSIYTDNEPLAKFLKKTAVPSIFSVPETKPITPGPLGKKGGRNTCCVLNCKNTGESSLCNFYRFPVASWKLDQRNKWIGAVKCVNGSQWSPSNHNTRICSAHFVGGKKSDIEASPSYIPMIFPTTIQKKKEGKALSRCTRVISLENTESTDYSGAVVDPLDIGDGIELEQTQPLVDDQDDRETSHRCNECGVDILGLRYTCVQCLKWDICNACEVRAAHALHYVLRVPRCKPPEEVKALVAAIRDQLINNKVSQQDTALSPNVVVKEENEEEEEPNTLDHSDTAPTSGSMMSQDITSEDSYAPSRKRLRLKQPSPNKNATKTRPYSRLANKSKTTPLDRELKKRFSCSTSTNMEDQTVPHIFLTITQTPDHEKITKANAQTILTDKIDDNLAETQAKDNETATGHNLDKPLTETRTVLLTPTTPVKLLGPTITLKKISPTDDVKLKIHNKGIRIQNLTKSTHLDKLKLPLVKSETVKVLADTSKASPNHQQGRLLIPISKRKILQVIPHHHSNRTTSKPLTTPVSNSQAQR